MSFETKTYQFDSLISQSLICQSWLARRKDTGKECLVKTSAPNAGIDVKALERMLEQSFRYQQDIISRGIVRARSLRTEDGRLFIEYPFLSPSQWKALTAEVFWCHFDTAVLQICFLIDYLHLLHLVHCDLKLENFLYSLENGRLKLKMADLDFLCPAGTHPIGKVVGTPNHIAPEILKNEPITVQSDSYSIGVAFEMRLNSFDSVAVQSRPANSKIEDLSTLCNELTHPDPLQRPRLLINSLLSHNLVDRDLYSTAQRNLLDIYLLTKFGRRKPGDLNSARRMKCFLQQDCKVLGLGEEGHESLAVAYHGSRRRAVRLIRWMIANAVIEMHADYWHLSLSDEHWLQLYKCFGQNRVLPKKYTQELEYFSGASLSDLLREAESLRKQGRYHNAFLQFKQVLKTFDSEQNVEDPRVRASVLKELGELATSLNLLHDGSGYFSKLLCLGETESSRNLELYYKAAMNQIMLGNLNEATSIIQQGGTLPPSSDKDIACLLNLKRLKGWILGLQSRHPEAEELLKRVSDEASSIGLHEVEALAHYSLGILYWRSGRYESCLRVLNHAFSLAKSYHFLEQLVPLLSALCLVHHELAQFREAVKYGKLAIKYTAPNEQAWKLPSIYISLASAYTRLSDFNKARFWLNGYLSLEQPNLSVDSVLLYYLTLAYLELNCGNIRSCKEALHKVLPLATSTTLKRNAGKLYHNLAEAALYEGDVETCRSYASKGLELFEELCDHGSAAELILLTLIAHDYYVEAVNPDEFLDTFHVLTDNHCHYYASLCLFYMRLIRDRTVQFAAFEVEEKLTGTIQDSSVPLFTATVALSELDEELPSLSVHIAALKKAFQVLYRSGSTFFSMLVSRRIADLYQQSGRHKIAGKFYRLAFGLAESLGNQPVMNQVKDRLADVAMKSDQEARLIDSIRTISQALVDLNDYEGSIRRMVGFAVEQSGAERGVLLLRNKQTGQFFVGAAYRCDEDSLKDIKDFSSTIPTVAADNITPLIIKNAVSDKRTRHYQSIVYHNILSVACVPLVDQGEVIGALYLDHHSIPALFDERDISFILSIANFLTVTLRTLHDVRTGNQVRKQLVRILKQQGFKTQFITQDERILRLYDKLPQVAVSDVPILIQGESGTGKEILCQNIHELSQRSEKPLITLNCASLAESLIESELFGVAQNVATGVKQHEGKLEAADGGTLLLDEIGDMPVTTQAKILRVIEYQRFERVGSNRTINTDIRFIYASNKNIAQLVRQDKFREDLYHRISTIVIEIPPLRERPGDIPLLIEHFLQSFSEGNKPPRFSREALEKLCAYSWPGNVRELRNVVNRFCVMSPGELISVSNLPDEIRFLTANDKSLGLQAAQVVEASRMREALYQSNWNVSQAARLLDMPVTTCRRKMRKSGIRKP